MNFDIFGAWYDLMISTRWWLGFFFLIGFFLCFLIGAIIIIKDSGWKKSVKIASVFGWLLCFLLQLHMAFVGFIGEYGHGFGEKPVIYLYPKEKTAVHVTLSKPKQITCDYPEYNDGWSVVADPDGNLRDMQTGKNLYCLYYEAKAPKTYVEKDGFVIRSEDAADFLDEKLEILGLNDKERNEFIIYWLPRLEQSNYIYIRFLTKDEIDAYQKLNVEPSPDTVIRVMMSYKGLEEPIYVKEQPLDPAERAGFTVVEWGGIEMK